MFQLEDKTHKLLRGNDISIGGLKRSTNSRPIGNQISIRRGPQFIHGNQISIGGLKSSRNFIKGIIFQSEDKRSINFSERIKL